METKRLSSLLKLIANPDRMTILFMLMDSERSIAELSEALGQPATAVSNHLARLRSEGLIDFTRYHRIIEYGWYPKKPPPSSIRCAIWKTVKPPKGC